MSVRYETKITCDTQFCRRSIIVAYDKDTDISEAESRIANNGWFTIKSGEQHYCPDHAKATSHEKT